MNIESSKMVNIENCTKQLKIGRRRIYDIINILESFQVIKRIKKNIYEMKSAMLIK